MVIFSYGTIYEAADCGNTLLYRYARSEADCRIYWGRAGRLRLYTGDYGEQCQGW